MEPKLSGSYTTRRDGGVTYAYDGSWIEIEKTVKWDAKVRRAGAVVGSPSGVITDVPRNSNIDSLVRDSIQTAIEAKDKISA